MAKQKNRKYYLKAIGADGSAPYGYGDYPLPEDGKKGPWTKAWKNLQMCIEGWHCATPGNIAVWLSDVAFKRRLFVVERRGKIIHGGDKVVCEQIRFVRELKIPKGVRRRASRRKHNYWSSYKRYMNEDIVEILVANGIEVTNMPYMSKEAYQRIKDKYRKA